MEHSSTPSRYALLSVAEAAGQVSRARWFMYGEIKKRKIPYHQIGGCICISQTDLDAYVARSRVPALGEKRSNSKSKEVA
jgi:excisionase family DNA binding protein